MEATTLPIPGAENWTEQFNIAVSAQRERVRAFLAAQQERLQGAEDALAAQIQTLSEEMAEDRRQTRLARDELAGRAEELERQAQSLERMKAEIAARQADWDDLCRRTLAQQQTFAEQIRQKQDELSRDRGEILNRQAALAASESQCESEKKALQADRAELEKRQAESASLDMSLQALKSELAAGEEQLAFRKAETESQRRRIAREFKAQHEAGLREHEARLKEYEVRRSQLDQMAAAAADQAADRSKMDWIENANRALVTRVADLEKQLEQTQHQMAAAATAAAIDGIGREENENWRQRCETAMEELRELKARNEELQLQGGRSSKNGAPGGSGAGVLDWETEKQRILAALEADYDDEDGGENSEKIKIQEVVRKTDQILGEKEREIGELQEVLKMQTGSLGEVAVGAAAVGQIFDSDAVIREQREHLKRLETEWEEKLRRAEIEISMERAKIAREKSQLEEKIRAMERQETEPFPRAVVEQNPLTKPTRGRWLERLGLKDIDKDESR